MATARWLPPAELREWLDGIGEKVSDFSPVMQVIAVDLEQFVEDVVFPTGGEGEWQELAPATLKRHPDRAGGILQLSGDLRRRTGRDWSPRNAVVINRMPHAHFATQGTVRRRQALWQSKAGGMRRRSRAKIRELRNTDAFKGRQHEPSRDFMYVSDERAETLYGPMILDFVFSEI
jgi:phage gpG-like protein